MDFMVEWVDRYTPSRHITSFKRCFDVDITFWRWKDVVSTLKWRRVPAGTLNYRHVILEGGARVYTYELHDVKSAIPTIIIVFSFVEFCWPCEDVSPWEQWRNWGCLRISKFEGFHQQNCKYYLTFVSHLTFIKRKLYYTFFFLRWSISSSMRLPNGKFSAKAETALTTVCCKLGKKQNICTCKLMIEMTLLLENLTKTVYLSYILTIHKIKRAFL